MTWADFVECGTKFPLSPEVIPNTGDKMLLDMLYNPRHLPVIQSELSWVFECGARGIIHHRHTPWSDGYYSHIIYHE